MPPGEKPELSAAMLDRLMLNVSRLEGMAADVRTVAGAADPPVGKSSTADAANGLPIGKKRVPAGCHRAIYESRPNVTVDISVLCLKSGNAVFYAAAARPFTRIRHW